LGRKFLTLSNALAYCAGAATDKLVLWHLTTLCHLAERQLF